VAVLKRFRELLMAQRDRFRSYLEALDKQKKTIETGTAEDLIQQVELEEHIVTDIFSIQKVIDPLEELYDSLSPPAPPLPMEGKAPEEEVPRLKAALEDLKSEAIRRSERNKGLLSQRMEELRGEIKSLRANPYTNRRPAFREAASSLVNLEG